MAFTQTSATLITQTGTDTSLAGIEALTGATRSRDGLITTYTITSTLTIQGTLTINPEVERLIVDVVAPANTPQINVEGTGNLQLGTDITKSVGGTDFTRFSEGVAIEFRKAPDAWFNVANETGTTVPRIGYRASFEVESSGVLDWKGAEVFGPFNIGIHNGANVLIQDGIMTVTDISIGETDPTTGNAATATTGINNDGTRSVSNALGAGRGYISGFDSANMAIRGLTVKEGGEISFGRVTAGTNGVDANFMNTIEGYEAEHTVLGFFPNRTQTASLTDSRLANNGNDIDVTIQTENVDATLNNDGISTFTNTEVFNEAGGTALRVLGAENRVDTRNAGSVHIYRTVQFNAVDLADGTAVTDGGQWFMRDTDHGFRSNAAGANDTADRTYGSGFTSGTSSPVNVLLGAVKVARNDYTIGTTIITSQTAAGGPSGVNLGQGGRPRGTTNQPDSANLTNPYAMDLRGKVNTLGNDTFDFHVWHAEYNYVPLLDTDLSNDTTGNVTFNLSMARDPFYQRADYATTNLISTIDEIYKAEKDRKVNTPAEVELPTTGELNLTASGRTIDLGNANLTLATMGTTGGTTTTNRFSDDWTYSSVTSVQRGRFVIQAASPNVVRISYQNADSQVIETDVTSVMVGDQVRFHAAGTFADQTFTVMAVTFVGTGTNGYAEITLDGNVNRAGLDAFFMPTRVTITGSVSVTTPAMAYGVTYNANMNEPETITIETPTTGIATGTIFDTITTLGDFHGNALPLPAININARNFLGQAAAPNLDTAGGAYTGTIALMPGDYTIRGDWSGMQINRAAGETSQVNLVFAEGSTRPTAALGTGVSAPVTVDIVGRSDTGGRLDVWLNGSRITSHATSGNTNTYLLGGTGGTLTVVYTAPGRTDYYFSDTVTQNKTLTVTNEANPFPSVNMADATTLTSSSVITFTAGTNAGTGFINILDETRLRASAARTNYAIQNVVKGTEVYNDILEEHGMAAVDAVTSLGANSAAQLNGTYVTLRSTSPQAIGYVGQSGTTPIRTLVMGRFFTPGTSRAAAATWEYRGGGQNAGDGEFTYNGVNHRINIADNDHGGTDRSTTLGLPQVGDYMRITTTTGTLVAQGVISQDRDDTASNQHNFILNDALVNAGMLTAGTQYNIQFFDSTTSTINVGVTIGELESFDPGITASQIEGAVGTESDIANSLRFIRGGRNSVLPTQETYDPDMDYS